MPAGESTCDPLKGNLTRSDKGKENPGKPNMLFYADDMVLWGESKAELEAKMKTVIGTMEQFGLQVSTSKT